MARCTKCEQRIRCVVHQRRGERLRNQRSRCCGARMKRSYRHDGARAGSQARP